MPDNGIDQRVFGPYYGTPPHQRTEETRTETAFQQPLTPARRSLRQRLISRRRRRATNRP